MSEFNSLPTPPSDEVDPFEMSPIEMGPFKMGPMEMSNCIITPDPDINVFKAIAVPNFDFLTEFLFSLNKKLNSSDDTGVDDFTNFGQFLESFLNMSFFAVDLAIRSIGLFVILFVFFISMLFQPFFILSVILYRYILRRLFGITYGSAVNSADPKIHSRFAIKLEEQEYWKTIVDKLTTPPSDFDFDLAEFHLQLAALAYEPSSIVKETLLDKWPQLLDVKYEGFGSKNSGMEGHWILVVWSVKHNFVEIVFKGTSPYDLTEWLADCTMRKKSAKNGVLPGLVHAGFYDAFEFPNKDNVISDSTDDMNSICCRLQNIRREFGRDPPNLWITGHSLGAAMATVFTSILLWRWSPLGQNSTIQSLNWEKDFKLCGTYTYGNPRAGNKNWMDAIGDLKKHYKLPKKYKFYRVINANDIVCSLPFGGLDSLPFGKFFASFAEDAISDFCHLGEPVCLPFRFGKCVKSEREWGLIFKNLFLEFVTTPWELIFRGETFRAKFMTLLYGVTYGMIGFVGDHAPCEYLTNLKAAKLNDKSKSLIDKVLDFLRGKILTLLRTVGSALLHIVTFGIFREHSKTAKSYD